MYNGIDVSKHNGTIDWAKVKAAGIDFAMIRAGYGSNINQKDPLFDYNVTEAQARGIHCGAYWFSYALCADDAVREAQLFLEVVKPYSLTYPLAFDFEYDSVRYAAENGVGMTGQLASGIADAFMGVVRSAGYYVVNYTNLDYISRYYSEEVVNKYELWLAVWSKTKPSRVTGMWQYGVLGTEEDVKAGRATAVGSVPGISGMVDADYCYKDYPSVTAAMSAGDTGDAGGGTVPASAQTDETTGVTADGETAGDTNADETAAAGGISAGDTVKILSGAVYGGALPGIRGDAVPPRLIGEEFTVLQVKTIYGANEACLADINSWIAFVYLEKV